MGKKQTGRKMRGGQEKVCGRVKPLSVSMGATEDLQGGPAPENDHQGFETEQKGNPLPGERGREIEQPHTEKKKCGSEKNKCQGGSFVVANEARE